MMNDVIETAASLFDSILCIYFITKFNHAGFRRNKFWIPFTIVYFIFTLISDKYLPGFSIVTSFVLLAISFIYALLVSKKNWIRPVLSVCIYKVSLILLSSIIYLVCSIVINDFELLMQGSDYIGRYMCIILHKISLFAVLELTLFLFKADSSLDIKNGILTFLFTLITIIGLGATMATTAIPNIQEIQLQILIITLSFVASNIFLYFMISQIQKLQRAKYKLKLLEDKTHFEEARYNDANAIWTNIKKVQHDIKQHLTVINNYLDDEKIKECQEYIEELFPNVEHMGSLIRSDNIILDYLINSKLCPLKNTQVVISGSIGSLSDIKNSDLACLLGNILDNAIEAVEQTEDKRIELLFTRQNSNRIIICKNTIKQSVLNTNKELQSTKESQDSHGYGHQIVEKIVSDYHGMICYFEESDMFGVQILLPIIE